MSARYPSGLSTIVRVVTVAAGLIAAVLLSANPAWAGIGFQPANPDELKMISEPLAPGAPAIILYHQVDRDHNR